jgi:hypothetical protein
LTEQREKGRHALHIKEMLELIQEEGLWFGGGKTPISSLSSRLTEEVRKGPQSVVIRLGEGHFALRKGMDVEKLKELQNTLFNKNVLGDSTLAALAEVNGADKLNGLKLEGEGEVEADAEKLATLFSASIEHVENEEYES